MGDVFWSKLIDVFMAFLAGVVTLYGLLEGRIISLDGLKHGGTGYENANVLASISRDAMLPSYTSPAFA
jgi:hypothetical protein